MPNTISSNFYCDQSSYKKNRFIIFLGLARRKVVNQLRVHQVRHSTTPGGGWGSVFLLDAVIKVTSVISSLAQRLNGEHALVNQF